MDTMGTDKTFLKTLPHTHPKNSANLTKTQRLFFNFNDTMIRFMAEFSHYQKKFRKLKTSTTHQTTLSKTEIARLMAFFGGFQKISGGKEGSK